jgi:uncharacterized coiled-coil DUF342 family protein
MTESSIKKSLDAMIDKADDCSDLARAQRASADKMHESSQKQHANAHKLEAVGEALIEEVAEIKTKLDKALADAAGHEPSHKLPHIPRGTE